MPRKSSISALDRVLLNVAPNFAVDRLVARESFRIFSDTFGSTGGGYEGAEPSLFRRMFAGIRSKPVDEDHHLGTAADSNLRLEARDLRRNYGVISGYARRFPRNIVGSGIHAEWLTDSESVNTEYEDYFRDWKSRYDVRGRMSFDDSCRAAINARLFDGNGLDIKLANGQCQPIEAERIATPTKLETDKTIINGVKVVGGVIKGFYVCPRDDSGNVDKTKWDFVAADDAVFYGEPSRVDQVRSVPELAPILTDAVDFRMAQKYQLNKFKLDQLQGWAIFRKGGGIPSNLIRRHTAAGGTNSTSVKNQIDGLNFYNLDQGDNIQSLASNTPNPQHETFGLMCCRYMAACLCVPVEFFLLDLRNLSWSTSRTVTEQAKSTILDWHDWLIQTRVRKLALWAITYGIKNRELPPPPVEKKRSDSDLPRSQLLRVRFSVPDYAHIQREAEADADEKEWNLAKTSLDEIARKRGLSGRDELLEAKAGDIRAAAVLAKKLTQETGVLVNWTDLINAAKAGVAPATAPQITPPDGGNGGK